MHHRMLVLFIIGCQEESKLFTQELPKYFSIEECELIEGVFRRYMDDDFIFWRKIILHSDNTVETDIDYKDTNAHDYLPYNSARPKHCKDNLPYNLAKRIIVFVSNDEKVEMRLKELKTG